MFNQRRRSANDELMRYKKVLLVSPRIGKGRNRLALHPLAGIGYVAEALKNAGVEVAVLDMNLGYTYHDLRQRITDLQPDVIALTVMTFGFLDTYELINIIHNLHPQIKIVVGGPHVSTLREKVLYDCQGIDYAVILEGDISFVQLCSGKEYENISGFIYRENGKITVNEFKDFILTLDELAFPKYEAFELDKYPTRQIGIVTSRGCPYSCIYCPVIAAIGKRYRARSAQSVVAEIDYWYGMGYREILILDDNFTLIRKRTEEICNLLLQKGYKDIHLKCPNGIRADMVDHQLLKTMRAAGFDLVAFGVEAGSDKILKNIKKGEIIKTIEQGIKDACALGFDVDLFFLIGSPGETMEDIYKSFSLALRYPVRTARFYNIIPFPETELLAWINTNGYLLNNYDFILNNASHFVNEPCFYTPELSAEERKIAFKMGQAISLKIRRKYYERKLNLPFFFKRMISWAYTDARLENWLINNYIFTKIKQKMKNIWFNNK